MDLNFQMIGVAELTHENMFDSLSRVAKIGYMGVEFAGYKGWTPRELRKMLDDLGLKCVGSHFKNEDHVGAPGEGAGWYIEAAKDLGMPTVCLAGFDMAKDEFSAERVDSMKDGMNAFVSQCKAEGLRCYFHTSLDYFVLNERGQAYIDQILANVPELDVEVDTIWCLLGGKDPVEYVRQYAGRETLLHYKDLTQEIYDQCNINAPGTLVEHYAHAIRYADTPSGMGIQRGPELIDAAIECGITEVIVEQMGNANQVTREMSLDIARQAYDAMSKLMR